MMTRAKNSGVVAYEEEALLNSSASSGTSGTSGSYDATASDEPHFTEVTYPGEGMTKTGFYVTIVCSFSFVFFASMDSTMVATLLSVMADDLNAMDNISWVATSYLLSCAAFQPLFGKFSDVFGRKYIVLLCASLFGLGCLLSGTAPNLWWLVVGRFITGIGGGGFFSMGTIILSDVVPNRQRGLYQGFGNVFFNAGAAGGGVLAGIIERLCGWRASFLFQVPVCVVLAFLTYRCFNLPPGNKGLGIQGASASKKLRSLDYSGSTLMVVSLLMLLLAASAGGKEIPFSSYQFKSLVAFSLAGLTGFYFYEMKVAAEPVIPMRMLHDRTILASALDCMFTCMNMFVSLFYLPFYWSSVKNISALDCGLRLVLGSIVASLSSIFAGWYIKKTSRYWYLLQTSGVAMILGSLIIYSSSKSDSAFKDSIVNLPLRYSGSVNITVILVAMISAVSHSDQALVTSIQYGFRSTGSTVGVSIANCILEYGLRYQIDHRFAHLKDVPEQYQSPAALAQIKRDALKNPHYAFEGAPAFSKNVIVSSYDDACHYVFMFLFVTAVASQICTLFVRENKLEAKPKEQPSDSHDDPV